MPDRQTMNVSLPVSQEKFVRSQVSAGRYRSASEVLRDGLRLLQEAEQRRLLEKWLHEGLTKQEEKQLSPELLQRAKAQLRSVIDTAIKDVKKGRVVEGPEAMKRLRSRLQNRSTRKSA